MKAEVAKTCVEENGYATPVLTAIPLLAKEVRNSKTVFPDKEMIAAGEFQTDVGEALAIYQKYWEKLRAGN
jgi:spermidine/putrescine transport system substrate-binding protein